MKIFLKYFNHFSLFLITLSCQDLSKYHMNNNENPYLYNNPNPYLYNNPNPYLYNNPNPYLYNNFNPYCYNANQACNLFIEQSYHIPHNNYNQIQYAYNHIKNKNINNRYRNSGNKLKYYEKAHIRIKNQICNDLKRISIMEFVDILWPFVYKKKNESNKNIKSTIKQPSFNGILNEYQSSKNIERLKFLRKSIESCQLISANDIRHMSCTIKSVKHIKWIVLSRLLDLAIKEHDIVIINFISEELELIYSPAENMLKLLMQNLKALGYTFFKIPKKSFCKQNTYRISSLNQYLIPPRKFKYGTKLEFKYPFIERRVGYVEHYLYEIRLIANLRYLVCGFIRLNCIKLLPADLEDIIIKSTNTEIKFA